jgi:hypothetical protein
VILKFIYVLLISFILTVPVWFSPGGRLYTGIYKDYTYSVTIYREPFRTTPGSSKVTRFYITRNGKVVASYNRKWYVNPESWDNIEATFEIIDRVKNAPD